MQTQRRAWRAIAIDWLGPLGLMFIATCIKWAVDTFGRVDTGFLFCLCAVVMMSGLFSLGPSLLAIPIAAAAQTIISHWSEPVDIADFVQIALFVSISLFIVAQAHRIRRSQLAGQKVLDELLKERRFTHALRDQFDSAINTVTDPLAILCPIREPTGHITDFRIEYINDAGARSTNKPLTRIEQTGMTICAIVPELVELGIIDAYAKVLETGEAAHFESQIPLDNGSPLFDIRATRFDGKVVVQWHDVTEQRLNEAKVADSERHYRQLAEGLPQLTWTCDSAGNRDFISERWAQYTGVPVEQQLERRWQDQIHPDDRRRLLEAWKHAAETGKPFRVEYRLRRYDGEYRWFDSRALPLADKDGRTMKWFGTSLDIEDRRQAEHRFRRLYESNLVGVVFSRADGQFIDTNDAILELLGYSAEEKSHLNWRALTSADSGEIDQKQMGRLHETGRCGPFEKELIRKDGSRVQVLFSAADVEPDEHDEVVAFVVDLTRIKHVEEALRRTETNLRLLNESLERRVRERTSEAETRSEQLRALALDLAETESRERKRLAQLLHDHFQQLVSAAKLKAGLLRRRCQTDTDLAHFKQMESLLEEAILASRSLAMELSPPVLHDGGLCAAIEWLARRMENNHNLLVKLETDADCEPDNEQVRTVLFECARELLFNVVKHSGSQSADVFLKSPQPGLLQLRVADHGAGFDPNNIQINQKPDGSFGLFSIRERLGLIGGQIQIESKPGKGTVIDLVVPVTLKTHGEPSPQAAMPEPSPTVAAENVPTVRVLVADDHKLFREGLISMISQESFINVVGQTGDGAEAVELARQLQPDILIVDVTMPNLNGVQVTAQVSKELPRTRIVGLSMHETDDMAKAMRDAGAIAYCTKGAEVEILLGVLRTLAMDGAAEANPAVANS